jgi:hypothetical protein
MTTPIVFEELETLINKKQIYQKKKRILIKNP